MYNNIEMEYAYRDGKISGKNSAIECICEDIEEIIDTYADGEEITKALKNLICKYREELI